MQSWNIGDRVRLKSGGPVMTVVDTGYDNNGVRCQWFAGAEPKDEVFPSAALDAA